MSYIFFVDGPAQERRWVWSPASRPGELYVGLADTAASVFDTPTGLTAIAADFHQVDPAQFEVFVRTVFAAYSDNTHSSFHELLRPLVLLSVAMLRNCGVELEAATDKEREILELAATWPMPT